MINNVSQNTVQPGSVVAGRLAQGSSAEHSLSLRQRLRRCRDRQLMHLALILVIVAGWIGRRRKPALDRECEILLTGRFDSPNWILAHLGPLANSNLCTRVYMVSTYPVPVLPKVQAIYPAKWLVRVVGATPARLLTFTWVATRKRPHIVGGFHLLYNGIAAAIAGRLAGARTMYICVGGTEVANDGVQGEFNCFVNTQVPDERLKEYRLRIIAGFDIIITMGTRAARFFRDHGISARIQVISGGIDSQRFQPATSSPEFDLILAARLSAEKRVDVFLHAMRLVADKIPLVKAVIVGDGPLRSELQRQATELNLDRNVEFLGYKGDVENWLRRSKVFVLTSDLEGLPLSVMEAMMCGLPAVVSNVGDLGDLAEDGANGYLVPRRSPELLAGRIIDLLSDEGRLKEFSRAARCAALEYEVRVAAGRWDETIARFRTA